MSLCGLDIGVKYNHHHNAELYSEVAKWLDYAIIMIVGPHLPAYVMVTANFSNQQVADPICQYLAATLSSSPRGHATERLSNGFFHQSPAGHGLILTECALDLIAQFLADPTQAPDSICIGEMEMAWVLAE